MPGVVNCERQTSYHASGPTRREERARGRSVPCCGLCAMMCMPLWVDNHEHEEMLSSACALMCVMQQYESYT